MEKTLLIIKPDAVEARNVGDILSILEREGYKLLRLHHQNFSNMMAECLYQDHVGKNFYENLIKFMISGPSVLVVLEKKNAIKDLRKLVGVTDPKAAAKGTLRYKFGKGTPNNAVHSSGSRHDALRELYLFFGESEDLKALKDSIEFL